MSDESRSSNQTKVRRGRTVGVYDRPKSADRHWLRWIIIMIGLLLSIISLWRLLG